MAMSATEVDRNGDVVEFEYKYSPDVSMDGSQEEHSQTLDSCDVDTPVPTTKTSTRASSTASLHDEIKGESDYDFVESVEIDEKSIPGVIMEICPVDGPCVQCEIEQPCSFRFTDNGETLYACNEPCIKAYQAEHPGKYTVTRKKYIIEEITPKTLLCSECEQNKTCYFYHNYDGEETYYCSLNCLDGMMADEKDKYTFKLHSVTIGINQILPKEGQCHICEIVKPCEFLLVRYGEPCFLCGRACIKILSVRERGRYYIKKLRVNKTDVSNAIDKNLDEGYKIQAKAAAMAQREQSFHRRCSQCTLILMIDENVLTWEAMDFCDEICLERFQNGIGSRCVKCKSLVMRTSLGKFCVRIGYDIRQFCNSSCLGKFKKGLKICCYCQRVISASMQVFRVQVGAKKHIRYFCAQSCVEKFDQMSKNPVPQPVWAKCAVCSLEKATTIEMEVTEAASQRICSDPCFAAYKFFKNILPDQCKWCKKYFERKPTQSFTTYDDSNRNCFCSLSCMTIHIHRTRCLVSCNRCKSTKYNFDMIRRVDNDQAVMMCSLNCLNLYQKSENALSSSNGILAPILALPVPSIEQGRADVTTGVPAPTLATPVPSIEQGRADVTTFSDELLVTLTNNCKRGETTQSSEQEEQQIEKSASKLPVANPDSQQSGRKKPRILRRGRSRGGARSSGGSADGGVRGQIARLLDFTHAGPSSAQPPAASPSPATSLPPSVSHSIAQSQPKQSPVKQLKKVQSAKVADKKIRNIFLAEQKATLDETLAKKQTSRCLLPDAPPRKKQKSGVPAPILAVPVPSIEQGRADVTTGVPAPTLATPVPSIEQDRADVTTFSDELLVTLTNTCKRGETTQSSEQEEQQIEKSASKLPVAKPDSQPSGRKKPRILRRGRSRGGARSSGGSADGGVRGQIARLLDFTKSSTRRGSCALVAGVPPVTPPLRKVQPWEKSLPASSIGSPRAERSTPSPQYTDKNFEDNEFLGIPDDVDPGSDIDVNVSLEPEDVGDAEFTGYRPHSSLVTEDLPLNLVRLLEDMDTRDDSHLREEASNPDMLNFNWSNEPDTFTGQQETFSGEAGPTFSLDGLSPLDVFQLIWDSEILDLMVRETNRYGRQLYSTANKLWSDVNISDIWIFLALIMLQSILILPVEREYWYPCITLLKVGDFHKIMPMKEFLRIKRCLHFVDNGTLTATGEDQKIKKIQPIVTHLNDKFSSLYLPEQHIAIEESLLVWKGPLSFVQLIATKAARVGIKSYELCESRTGYLWKFLFYTGKGDQSQPSFESANHDEPEATSSKIVYNLVRPLLHKGHTLVMDSLYNSPLLSRSLKTKRTDTLGTLRLKREFVPDSLRKLTKSDTRVGEVIYTQTEDITITVWHDANIIAMISTFHKAVVGGKEKHGTYKKPQVALDYNMAMGGVKKRDQMLQAFPVERLCNPVWYKKLFRRLLNVSIYNAFVIYNHNKNGTQRQFRVALAKEILNKIQGQIPDPRNVMKRASHFPTRNETKRARCRFCSLKKVQSRTAFKCDTCNVNLCIVDCFREYHLMMKW